MVFIKLFLLLVAVNSIYSQVVLTQSEQSVVVSPGGSHKLSCACSGFSVSGTSMYWIRQAPGKGLEWIIYYYSDSNKSSAQTVQGRFTASKDNSNFYLHMSQLKTEDTAVYYCARDYGLGYAFDYWGKGTQVTVTNDEPKKPVVFMMSECNTSESKTLGCLASEYSPATALSFKWTDQSGNPLTDFVQHPAVEINKKSMKISYITVKKDKLSETSITCEAVNPSENVKKTFRKAEAPTLSLVPVITRKSTSVMCVIEDFHPKTLTVQWKRNNTNIQQQITPEYTQNEEGLYTARSLYTVSSETWNKHTEYTCEVTHMGQVKRVTQNFKATLELTLKSPIQKDIFLFGDVILQAVVSGNEHKAVEDASVSCTLEKKALTLNKAEIQSQDNSVFQKIHNVTVNRDKWFAGEMVTCTISDKNIMKKKSFDKGDSKKPSVVLYEQQSDSTNSSHVSLVCEVSSPQLGDVYIMWRVDNGKYEEGNTSAPIHRKDSTSVISLFEVSDKQYEESTISCAVVHANMDNTRSPLITTASKSKPSCPPCPASLADYFG